MNPRLSPDDIERIAHQRAGAKLGWYVHAVVYVVVNLFIFGISRYGFGDRSWPVVPMLGWGLGLALHGAAVLLLGSRDALRQRLVQHERDELRHHRRTGV